MSAFPSRRHRGRKVNAGDIRKAADTVGKVADIGGTILSFIPGVGPAVNAALQVGAGAAKAAAKVAGKAEEAEAAGKKLLAKHRKRRAKGGLRKAAAKTTAAAKKAGVSLPMAVVRAAHKHVGTTQHYGPGGPEGEAETDAATEDAAAALVESASAAPAVKPGLSNKAKAAIGAAIIGAGYLVTRRRG